MTKSIKIQLIMPIIYLLLSSVLFMLSWPRDEQQFYHYVGVILALVSFVLWIMARVQLGNAFSIIPKAKYIVKTGLYSKLRHPVYYFSITALVGIGMFVWHALMLIPIILLIFLEYIRIKQEEKVLIKEFGKEYEKYKKQTWF